jgi:protein arginine N-methyltransferase 1
MSMDYYRGMLIQDTRIDAFRRAIRNAVRPGDRVLDIGSGLGTYAFFAAQAGAARVWGVEGGSIINVARTLARLNGFADQVEFLHGWFPGVAIPDTVDVLVFEDFGPRLIDPWTHRVERALHAGVLRAGARVIPHRARLFLAPVTLPEIWPFVGRFDGESDRRHGIDWFPSHDYIRNTPLSVPIRAADLRHEPRAISDVPLDRVPAVTDLTGEAEWTFAAETTLHGIAFWFDLDVGGTWLSNAPGGDPRSWGNLFLPLDRPLTARAGDRVTARVAPETAADGGPSWFTWEVRCGTVGYRGHEFKAEPASLADLTRRSPSWIPELTEEAKLEGEVLRLADGTRTVDQIAEALGGGLPPLERGQLHTLVLNALADRTLRSARATTR